MYIYFNMKMRKTVRQCYGLLLIFLLIGFSARSDASIRWLALARVGSVGTIKTEDTCDHLKGLVNRQKKVCRRNVEVMDSVGQGAKLAIDECQWQFRSRRWNCSTVDSVAVFGNVLNQGTREAAFVHAMSSAGVAHAVTRACSSGALYNCGCDMKVRGKSPQGFDWSGCSENIVYGSAFAKQFVDARDRNRGSDRAMMNLHNNEAGRKAVEDHMKTDCKCHGVSGSCEIKTCWRAMPTFRDVGDILKEKFDGATEVTHQRFGTRRQLVPLNKQFKPHTRADLVYLTASPDFCEPDAKIGSLGTQGRLCNKSSKAIDGCDLLCCGRGYRSTKRKIVERCYCKFHWCCDVKCQQCEKTVEEHYCL